MNTDTGNIYGPDEARPDVAPIVEIDEEMYDALVAARQKDIEAALRAVENKRSNPGR